MRDSLSGTGLEGRLHAEGIDERAGDKGEDEVEDEAEVGF